MIDESDFEAGMPAEEREALGRLCDRLERDRPLPDAVFRGELRRQLVSKEGRSPVGLLATRWRVLAATYSGLGAVLLVVAGVGLAGLGPFGAG
jgi:hypothetical protein